MTDYWVGLPTTKGFKGIENQQPKFNTHEQFYTIIIDEVEYTTELYDEGIADHSDVKQIYCLSKMDRHKPNGS